MERSSLVTFLRQTETHTLRTGPSDFSREPNCAGLDMSQLSTRPEERSRCSTARRSPIQVSGPRNAPYMRFRNPAGHVVEKLPRGPTGAAPAELGT